MRGDMSIRRGPPCFSLNSEHVEPQPFDSSYELVSGRSILMAVKGPRFGWIDNPETEEAANGIIEYICYQ